MTFAAKPNVPPGTRVPETLPRECARASRLIKQTQPISVNQIAAVAHISLAERRISHLLGFAAHGAGRLYAGVQTERALIAKLILLKKSTSVRDVLQRGRECLSL